MQLTVGSIVEGKVTGITKFGAFVDLGEGKTGMVHISEVASTYVKEISDHLTQNQMVKVKILNISPEGKIGLSIKKAMDPPVQPASTGTQRPSRPSRPSGGRFNSYDAAQRRSSEPLSFEDMLSKFKQTSDDKMSDIKRNLDTKRGSSRKGPK